MRVNKPFPRVEMHRCGFASHSTWDVDMFESAFSKEKQVTLFFEGPMSEAGSMQCIDGENDHEYHRAIGNT